MLIKIVRRKDSIWSAVKKNSWQSVISGNLDNVYSSCVINPASENWTCAKSQESSYSDSSKGYRIWIPDEIKVIVSRDVKFLHIESPKENRYEDFYPGSVENSEEVDINKNNDHDIIDVKAIRESFKRSRWREYSRSTCRMHRTSQCWWDAVKELQKNDPSHDAQEAIRRAPRRPKIVKTGERRRPRKEFHYYQAGISERQSAHLSEIPMRQTMSGPEADDWRLVMVKEIKSIIKNDTWKLVDRVDDRTIIGTRMILRNKLNSDGSIHRQKVWLIA